MGNPNFSQRFGLSSNEPVILIDSLSPELRNSLWNVFYVFFLHDHAETAFISDDLRTFAQFAAIHFFKNPVDEVGDYFQEYVSALKTWFMKASWNLIYEFLEYLVGYCRDLEERSSDKGRHLRSKKLKNSLNKVLEEENSAYRFIDDVLVQTTSSLEISEIEEGVSHREAFAPVAEHLRAALLQLKDKRHPNFRNSIKESISAVEAAAKISTGEKGATLGLALAKLERSGKLHPCLKSGFTKLYEYTSDSDGIRHALLTEPSLDYADAKYMLVTCAAFANYLITRLANPN